MRCPDCNSNMGEIKVKVEGARNKAISYQCLRCGHFEFEKESSNKVIQELKVKETPPLEIKQKIIKLSQNRIGMYFNQNIVRSIGLKAGEEVYVSVPDKKHVVINLENKRQKV